MHTSHHIKKLLIFDLNVNPKTIEVITITPVITLNLTGSFPNIHQQKNK